MSQPVRAVCPTSGLVLHRFESVRSAHLNGFNRLGIFRVLDRADKLHRGLRWESDGLGGYEGINPKTGEIVQRLINGAAAKELGFKPSSMAKATTTRGLHRGLRWRKASSEPASEFLASNPPAPKKETARSIEALDADGRCVVRFSSVKQARKLGYEQSQLYRALCKGTKYRGFHWRYVEKACDRQNEETRRAASSTASSILPNSPPEHPSMFRRLLRLLG